ncbi:MAG: hypothetical protein ABIG96_00705 [Candidatus Micrarchaeota archaeon]
MGKITASAPSKVIIAGEHSVVYGGIALAAPLDNRKKCECKYEKVGERKGCIEVDDSVGDGKYLPDGSFEDKDGWFRAKAKVIDHILKSEGKSIDALKIRMNFSKNKIPKGTGHSAATAAVLSLCLYGVFGITPGKQKLFDAVQQFEEIAHGGRPSGIDAHTVISDGPQEFRKEFLRDGNVKFRFEGVKLDLPKGSVLLVINTLKRGELPETTGGQLDKFAKKAGVGKKPAEMSERERGKITGPFDELVEKIKAHLSEDGNAAELGGLFNKNHELLKKYGVSEDGIEAAREICLQHGAYGGKITGAGGRGGAIIALCRERDADKILKKIRGSGMDGVKAVFSTKGARIV